MTAQETRVKHWWRALKASRTARTALAYSAAGWLLIQFAATVFQPLGVEQVTTRTVIIVVVLGFVAAILIALVLDVRAGRIAPAAAPGQRVDAPASEPSVAVLPFADMSPDKDQAYFCEGAAEEIINALHAVTGLRVASRSSSFQFKDRGADHREIAHLLNVRAILDGSVRKAGERVRVAAQLIRAADGSHLWSETFDRKLEDIFAIQEEIARSTVRALRVTLLEADGARLQRHGTGNPAAYDFYLRGRQLVPKEKEAENRAAAQLFREAIRLDPEFALAHAALAGVIMRIAFRRRDLPQAAIDEARRACERALALQPELADAHVALGQIQELDKRAAEAARSFERALVLDPRLFNAHYYYGRFCVAQGDHARAIAHFEAAFALQPDDYRPITLAIQEYQALRDREGEQSAIRRSWAAIERRLAIDPDDSAAYDHGAGVLMLLGRKDDSREFSDRAMALRPDDSATAYNAACCAMLAGDHDRAIRLLERAIELGFGNLDWIMHDNDLVPLHDDARFKALMAKAASV